MGLDFSEELRKPVTEDEQMETSMLSAKGMHFPWLQKQLETVVTGGKKKKDFAQTTRTCLSFIQDALLKHQWQQAAEYMHSYLQTLEDWDSYKKQAAPEIIWKLGSEILFYHPKSNMETFNTFADRMKNIGVLNYLKISLQHALYLLHHGMLEEANRTLSQAETWRYGEKSSSQEILINLVQAYKGLLEYYAWSKKKMELSKIDEDDYAFTTKSRNMLSQSWKTSVNFCALIKTPGVWDLFVKSYVEMLEFYGDQDGAREVLTNYAYDEKFPSNPNAHIYLYNFLKREKAPRAKLISGAFVFLVLNHLSWVQEEWKSRKNWWPTFHFSHFWAKSDWKEDSDLACEKALVAGLLLGKGYRYFRYISKQDHEILRKKIKRMKKSVKKYSITNPVV
uniref:TATA-box binding protein associated factor, RNA polymerase I, A n=1 Tax=Jaculus jaculus TaxID=51337 RepID=A0A8C5K109_JACJA